MLKIFNALFLILFLSSSLSMAQSHVAETDKIVQDLEAERKKWLNLWQETDLDVLSTGEKFVLKTAIDSLEQIDRNLIGRDAAKARQLIARASSVREEYSEKIKAAAKRYVLEFKPIEFKIENPKMMGTIIREIPVDKRQGRQ
jgi:hypothetical protein